MATSSIFNNIRITDDASCRSLVEAIESSEKAKKGEPAIPSNVKVLNTKEEILRFFGAKSES
jgi:hypothetical protein